MVKIIKILSLSCIMLLVLFFLIAIFLPSKLRIKETKIIGADQNTVFNQINSLKKWEPWSPFLKADPGMHVEYFGAQKGVGSSLKWYGNNLDHGNMKIIDVIADSVISISVCLGSNYGEMSFKLMSHEKGTNLCWSIEADLDYPFTRYLGVFLKPQLKTLLRNGLVNLAFISSGFDDSLGVEIVDIDAVPSVFYKDSSSRVDFLAAQNIAFKNLENYIFEHEAHICGSPYCVFCSSADHKIVFKVGYPVDKVLPSTGKFHYGNTPSGRVASVCMQETAAGISDIHKDLQKWIKKNNFRRNGFPWEVYLNNSQTDVDNFQRQIKIFYPIKKH